MHMCKRRQRVGQEDNNLRHYGLGIDKAERTQDVKGTAAMMANRAMSALHGTIRELG